MGQNRFFIADGILYWNDGETIREMKSGVTERYIAHLQEQAQRNEWKKTGSGAVFMGVAEPSADLAQQLAAVDARALCIGLYDGTLLYTQKIDDTSGIYRKSTPQDLNEGVLLSDSNYNYREFAVWKDQLAFTAAYGMQCHVGLYSLTGKEETRFVTEGDSFEQYPAWEADGSHLWFSSAGVAKADAVQDESAAPQTPFGARMPYLPPILGPSALCRLQVESGKMEEVLSDPAYDFLKGKPDGEGGFYYIRRPYRQPKSFSLGGCLLDILLLPVHLILGIVGFFNFFTMLFAGKPLSNSIGMTKQQDPKRVILEDNLISADKELRKNRRDPNPGIVPREMELWHHLANGEDRLIRRGVIAYTLQPDQSVIFSNGSDLLQIDRDGKETRIVKAPHIVDVI